MDTDEKEEKHEGADNTGAKKPRKKAHQDPAGAVEQQKPELKIGWVWPTRLIFDLKLLSNKISPLEIKTNPEAITKPQEIF